MNSNSGRYAEKGDFKQAQKQKRKRKHLYTEANPQSFDKKIKSNLQEQVLYFTAL